MRRDEQIQELAKTILAQLYPEVDDEGRPYLPYPESLETILRLSAALSIEQTEPVGEQWCAFEDGHQHTSWYPDGYGDRAGWEALAKRNPVKYQIVTRPLYAHPPVSALVNAQADADVVERLRQALEAAVEWIGIVRGSCGSVEMPSWDNRDPSQIERDTFALIDAALSSLRPAEVGSATTSKGISE